MPRQNVTAIPAIKKKVILDISRVLGSEEYRGAELQLVTANGIIKGRPLNADINMRNKKLLGQLETILRGYQNDYGFSINDLFPGNDGYITLEDVQVIPPYGTIVQYDTLIVFIDQIIAMTYELDRIR